MASQLETNLKKIKSALDRFNRSTDATLNHTRYNMPQIPFGYTQVEYIQANGTCWANSGYAPMTQGTFEGKFYFGSSGSGNYEWPTPFGYRNKSYSSSFYLHNCSTTTFIRNNSGLGYGDNRNRIVIIENLEDYRTINFRNNDGVVTGSNTWTNLTSNTRLEGNLHLFRLNDNNGNNTGCFCNGHRIYYLKFYESGVLTRNYIPCKDINGTPCFYEAVTGATIYNSGSGSFIAGGEV